MQGYGGNLSKAYLKANMFAGESISNIRTVAFCAEDKVLDLYSKELLEPSKRSFRREQIAGILYGVSQYGSILMGKGLSSFESVMKTFMVLIVTALVMGEVLALAPDLLKENQMVASVFELLDRRTQVIGDTGEELSTVEGKIEFKGVHFSYPSRPYVSIFRDFDMKIPSGKSMALCGTKRVWEKFGPFAHSPILRPYNRGNHDRRCVLALDLISSITRNSDQVSCTTRNLLFIE
ncbi:unnamed protein product [Arabis nemorensis]|uniref:ABC transmembrane type-1 domain-containing protein n=1 Tax=Arabis nemorensis TaxID=586526 RepID=A0A565CC27_9BRAS|nr:unnamed protein product [Arabis nemorensis]